MATGSHRLYAADPHQWGPGKIHVVDPLDAAKTVCGKRLNTVPGAFSDASAPTCVGCKNGLVRRAEREIWEREYEARRRDRQRQVTERIDRARAAVDRLWRADPGLLSTPMPFGKYRGEKLGWIAKHDARYLVWLEENATSMRDPLRRSVSAILTYLRTERAT